MFFSGQSLQVVGHRGWAARHPDNSAIGIGAAFGVVDMVEVDIRRCADGPLVLSHDPEIGGHVVADTPWDRLREVGLGEGQRPVLLSEILRSFPDKAFNLEVKNSPFEPGFESEFGLALETAELSRPGDLLSSFYWPTMDAVRASYPRVATGLLLEDDIDLDAAIDHAIERGHAAVIPHWPMLDRAAGIGAIRRAHDAGIGVATWTVNDEAVANRLASAGVDAIITDDPGGLVAALGDQEQR
ncbi:MAG: glycerophosphodiester phosphodiesterase [Acidimicrobiia bacterium]|nr:glycerophosphodiester phosphodiesterase [Acidimicrobiia bacterium]MDH4308012.1 glycerophosphodiester phosphodiesterase [Acidimicrobiia bacterium]MDH5292285.1 glycerophosphodiester phosphodiesterase [Acidimicrobiia bacterium]MDH5521619.1 glycerophosphodiester phosphodiesterase [Acidimicrobiia bacterium]